MELIFDRSKCVFKGFFMFPFLVLLRARLLLSCREHFVLGRPIIMFYIKKMLKQEYEQNANEFKVTKWIFFARECTKLKKTWNDVIEIVY